MSSLAVFLILGGASAYAAVSKVGANEIKANSIKTGKIVKEAVTAGKLKKNAVTESRIADGAVTNKKIADNAVTTGKIADNAVTSPKIANEAVTNSKLGNGAVTGAKIANGTVSRSNIAESQLLPRAFAFVNADGTVDPAFSSGIPNGSHPGAGVFCFTVAFSPLHAQATVEADGDSNDFASVDIAGTNGSLTGCPAGANVKVEVEDVASGNVNEEFYLVVW
jgi:hypothetical protein